MTGQYSQTKELTVSASDKKMQYIGIASCLLSLGFIILSVFVSYFFMFGFAAFLIIGLIFIHFYNKVPREFTYDYNEQRLVIVKKDVVNKRSRILCLLLSDIESFGPVEGLTDANDIIAGSRELSADSYQIVFRENGAVKRLIFEPDDYLLSLLGEKLNG